jgi:acyl carrier protein
MELNDFIDNFASQFDETDYSEFSPETEFKRLPEWSSLSALRVIAMIDDEYGIALKGSDIREAKTIGDLFQAVSKRVP